MIEVLASRVLISPADHQASLAFYRDRLGLKIYREFPGGTVFFLGGGYLELSGGGQPGPASGAVRLWLQVPDAQRAEEALRAAGVPIVEPAEQKPWGLIEMVIQDPDGIRIHVVEVPPTHPMRLDSRQP